MSGVHVVIIRQVGNGIRLICGHALHRNDDESAPEGPRVHRMHKGGPGSELDLRYGHVAHT